MIDFEAFGNADRDGKLAMIRDEIRNLDGNENDAIDGWNQLNENEKKFFIANDHLLALAAEYGRRNLLEHLWNNFTPQQRAESLARNNYEVMTSAISGGNPAIFQFLWQNLTPEQQEKASQLIVENEEEMSASDDDQSELGGEYYESDEDEKEGSYSPFIEAAIDGKLEMLKVIWKILDDEKKNQVLGDAFGEENVEERPILAIITSGHGSILEFFLREFGDGEKAEILGLMSADNYAKLKEILILGHNDVANFIWENFDDDQKQAAFDHVKENNYQILGNILEGDGHLVGFIWDKVLPEEQAAMVTMIMEIGNYAQFQFLLGDLENDAEVIMGIIGHIPPAIYESPISRAMINQIAAGLEAKPREALQMLYYASLENGFAKATEDGLILNQRAFESVSNFYRYLAADNQEMKGGNKQPAKMAILEIVLEVMNLSEEQRIAMAILARAEVGGANPEFAKLMGATGANIAGFLGGESAEYFMQYLKAVEVARKQELEQKQKAEKMEMAAKDDDEKDDAPNGKNNKRKIDSELSKEEPPFVKKQKISKKHTTQDQNIEENLLNKLLNQRQEKDSSSLKGSSLEMPTLNEKHDDFWQSKIGPSQGLEGIKLLEIGRKIKEGYEKSAGGIEFTVDSKIHPSECQGWFVAHGFEEVFCDEDKKGQTRINLGENKAEFDRMLNEERMKQQKDQLDR